MLDDCKDFLDIYNKLQLNKALTNQLIAESNALLERLATFLGLDNDCEIFEDLAREIHHWRRINKTFVVSMLGKYKEPATAAVKVLLMPQAAPVQRD